MPAVLTEGVNLFNILKSKIKTNNILELTLNDVRLPKLVYEYTPTVKRRTYRDGQTDTHEDEGGPQWPVSHCRSRASLTLISYITERTTIALKNLGTVPMTLTLKNFVFY